MENKQHFIRKYKVKVDMASQITNHPSFQTVNIRQGTNDEEVIYVYYRISLLTDHPPKSDLWWER